MFFLHRAVDEVRIASNNQPFSILVLDVGAIIKSKSKIENTDLTTAESKGIFEISNSNTVIESMVPGENTKKMTEEKVEGSGDIQNLPVRDRDIYWGMGNRAATFILACKVAVSIEEGKKIKMRNEQEGKDLTKFSYDDISVLKNKEIISGNESNNNSEIDNNNQNTNILTSNNSSTHDFNINSAAAVIDNNIKENKIIETETVSSSGPIKAGTLDLLNAKDASAKILAESKVRNVIVDVTDVLTFDNFFISFYRQIVLSSVLHLLYFF